MPLPLLPIGIGLGSASAATAITYWLTGKQADPWEDKSVFNARMRDMQSLALALNKGFSTCKAFMSDAGQLTSWRGVRDNFSKFYQGTGTLVYSSPSSAQIDQAKAYASRFYFWAGEYDRLKCGGPVADTTGKNIDPYYKPPEQQTQTDWVAVAKWTAIGIGSMLAIKTIADVMRPVR